MIKAVSDILECLEQAKNAKSMQELLPVMMMIEPLEAGIRSFFEDKLKPIHDAIINGKDPNEACFRTSVKEMKDSDFNDLFEETKGFDWNQFLSKMKPGEAN